MRAARAAATGMPFLQVTLDVGDGDPAAAEDACFAAGALSVTLADAEDEPVLEPAPGATPLWRRVRVSALFPGEADADVVAALLAACLGLPAGKVTHEWLADRAWEREWLRDFRPMRFGRRLWICPGGQPAPDADAVVIELDPGLAFGTGTHPTTAMCLEWIDGGGVEGRKVLDYGCGSGILALAALRLGAVEACAVDIDPQALLATAENAARNGLQSRLRVTSPGELGAGGHDIVLANILAGPLVDLAPDLAQRVLPDGLIVLAGLLDEQAEGVARAYRPWFHMRVFAKRDGWAVLEGRRITTPG